MTRDELALSMGVNSRTIGTWEDAGMPVRTPGSRGRGNRADYDLAACRAWADANGRGHQLRTLIARDRTPRASPAPVVADLLENACPAILGALLAEGHAFEQATVLLSAMLVGVAYHLEGAGQPREAQRVMDILPPGLLIATHPLRLAALAFANLMRTNE